MILNLLQLVSHTFSLKLNSLTLKHLKENIALASSMECLFHPITIHNFVQFTKNCRIRYHVHVMHFGESLHL